MPFTKSPRRSTTGAGGAPTTRSAPSTSSPTMSSAPPRRWCARASGSRSRSPLSDLEGIQTGLIRGRANPLRTMVSINTAVFGDPSQFCTSDDVVFMGLQAGTHWDGLGHATYDGRMWNGHPDLEHRRVGCVEVRHPQDPLAHEPWRAPRRRAVAGPRRAPRGLPDPRRRPRRRVRARQGDGPQRRHRARAHRQRPAPARAGARHRRVQQRLRRHHGLRDRGSTTTTSPRSPPTTSPSRCSRART